MEPASRPDGTPAVVVTGAGSGLGRATAERFARGGWYCLLVGRTPSKLEATAALLEDGPGCAVAALDVAEPGAMDEAVRRLVCDRGRVDALVANAGINPVRASALDTPDEAWHETMRVNLDGVHRSCKAVLPHMIERRHGAIVAVASIAGRTGMAARGAYGPSKAAVVQYVRNLAVDHGRQGIRANSVSPGFVVTDLNRAWLESLPKDALERLVGRHLLGLGAPENVADAIHFLCSDESSWITGVDLPVDGGYLAH